MAGTFSGHLIDTFLSAQRPSRGPFGQASTSMNPQIVTQGAMAFSPQMHGSIANATQPSSFDYSHMDLSEETANKIAQLQAKLDKKLGPEYISQRPGPGGGPKLTYAEGMCDVQLHS